MFQRKPNYIMVGGDHDPLHPNEDAVELKSFNSIRNEYSDDDYDSEEESLEGPFQAQPLITVMRPAVPLEPKPASLPPSARESFHPPPRAKPVLKKIRPPDPRLIKRPPTPPKKKDPPAESSQFKLMDFFKPSAEKSPGPPKEPPSLRKEPADQAKRHRKHRRPRQPPPPPTGHVSGSLLRRRQQHRVHHHPHFHPPHPSLMIPNYNLCGAYSPSCCCYHQAPSHHHAASYQSY